MPYRLLQDIEPRLDTTIRHLYLKPHLCLRRSKFPNYVFNRAVNHRNNKTFFNHMIRTISRLAIMTEKMEWLVILPDRPGQLEKRMTVRNNHIENLKKGQDEGFWKLGGAYLEELPKNSTDLKILGSVVIALASSREEVISRLMKDVYAESNIWDLEKVQIYPFKCAFRTAL